MFLLWLRQLPRCGDQTPASVPLPTEGTSSPINTPVFPPSSFVLPSFAWVYIFFSAGQVLLSALSWCSACTSMSEGVSWCFHGERFTPHPPIPPPSCSPPYKFFLNVYYGPETVLAFGETNRHTNNNHNNIYMCIYLIVSFFKVETV